MADNDEKKQESKYKVFVGIDFAVIPFRVNIMAEEGSSSRNTRLRRTNLAHNEEQICHMIDAIDENDPPSDGLENTDEETEEAFDDSDLDQNYSPMKVII